MDEYHDRDFRANEYLDRKADEAQRRAQKIANIVMDTILYTAFFVCGVLMF